MSAPTDETASDPRSLATAAGEVDLAIPNLRQGPFLPSLPCPGKRVGKALYAVTCSAWIEGGPTRKVDDLVRASGNDSGISRPTASRTCKDTDEAVGELLTRPLDHTWFPYVLADATYVDVRVNHRLLERVTGIEPACAAWKAAVLPLNYTRARGLYNPWTQPLLARSVKTQCSRRPVL